MEILRKGGGVLVDGGPPGFAAAVLNLLGDDGKRNHLSYYEGVLSGRAGRR